MKQTMMLFEEKKLKFSMTDINLLRKSDVDAFYVLHPCTVDSNLKGPKQVSQIYT